MIAHHFPLVTATGCSASLCSPWHVKVLGLTFDDRYELLLVDLDTHSYSIPFIEDLKRKHAYFDVWPTYQSRSLSTSASTRRHGALGFLRYGESKKNGN